MTLYEIEGKKYGAIDGGLYELIPVQALGTSDPLEALVAQQEEEVPEEPVRRKTGAKKVKKISKAANVKRSKHDPEKVAALVRRVEAKEISNAEAAAKLGVSYANWHWIKKSYVDPVKKKKYGSRPEKQESQDQAKDDVQEEEKPVLVCHICELDHMTRDCPDFGAKVAEMRESGMDSLQIASKLKIRLKDVPVD